MLVRDYTKNYGAGGGQFRGFGDIDWAGLIKTGIEATAQTIGAVSGAVAAGAKAASSGTQATQGTVSPGGTLYFSPPAQYGAGTPQKAWYQDPLTLGAVGLGAVGLLFVLKGSGRGRMNGFSGFGRVKARRSRRRSRR